MSVRQTKVECGGCGGDEMVIFTGDPGDDGLTVVYVECGGCGASVLTVSAVL